MLGLRRSDVTASGRAHDNQRCTRSIIDAGAATAPDLNLGRIERGGRMSWSGTQFARVAAETVRRAPIGGHRTRPSAQPLGRCRTAASMATLEEANSLGILGDSDD